MNAHGVEIFDGADHDRVVGKVAHHFQLEFLPTQYALFDENFMDRRKVQTPLQNFVQLFAIVGDASAGASHRKAGPQDHRITDTVGERDAVVNVVDQLRLRRVQADLAHGVLEQQPVFGLLDGLDLGADQLYVVFIERSSFGQFHG